MERPTIAICLPAPTQVNIDFALSLAGICHVTPARLMLIRGHSSLSAAKARNICLEKLDTLEQMHGYKAEWTFWLDSDMQVPPNALAQLLSHDKDIVGASYLRRTEPHDLLGEPLSGPIQTSGLSQFKIIPAGCLLVRRKVFETLGRWMIIQGKTLTEADTGEDVVFCHMAANAGYSVWCDLDLTRQVVHWGDLPLQAKGEESPLVLPKPVSLVLPEGARMNGRS